MQAVARRPRTNTPALSARVAVVPAAGPPPVSALTAVLKSSSRAAVAAVRQPVVLPVAATRPPVASEKRPTPSVEIALPPAACAGWVPVVGSGVCGRAVAGSGLVAAVPAYVGAGPAMRASDGGVLPALVGRVARAVPPPADA